MLYPLRRVSRTSFLHFQQVYSVYCNLLCTHLKHWRLRGRKSKKPGYIFCSILIVSSSNTAWPLIYLKMSSWELINSNVITAVLTCLRNNALALGQMQNTVGFISKVLVPGTNSSTAKGKVRKALGSVSTLLPIPDDCLHSIHKSVKDWLTDTSCYGEHEFIMDKLERQRILSDLCTELETKWSKMERSKQCTIKPC